MKNIFKHISMLFVGLLISVSCNASIDTSNLKSKEQMNYDNQGKVLIVFFSHTGENIAVGNIKVGNTKLVADEIQRITDGDEFEIVAKKDRKSVV